MIGLKNFEQLLKMAPEGGEPGGTGGEPGKAGGTEPNPNPDGGNEPEGGKGPEDPKGDEKKYTDKDVDEIINRKFADWQKKTEKAIDEAKKLEQMNAQQQAEYERDKLKGELEDLRAANTRSEMKAEARKMLKNANVPESEDIVNILVNGTDAEKTKLAVESFAKIYTEAVAQGVKDALAGKPPKTGTTPPAITREQILEVKDAHERQKLIGEHIELFQKKE